MPFELCKRSMLIALQKWHRIEGRPATFTILVLALDFFITMFHFVRELIYSVCIQTIYSFFLPLAQLFWKTFNAKDQKMDT